MAFFNKVRGILQHTVRKHMNREVCAPTPSIFQAVRCMSTKLFVGGLPYQTDETSLLEAFEKYGEVVEARIIKDRESGNSRGFGFVTFQDTEAASSAIMALDGKDFQGRIIRVNHAHDRAQGGGGGGYGNYVGGYGGGGGGYGSGGNYGGDRNYNNNFGANHAPRSNDGGYGTIAEDSYASGGGGGVSYASRGGSYGGGNNYASGGGNYGGNNFEFRNVGYDSGNNQNFSVAGGGVGGSDNYFVDNNNAGSGFTSTGFNSNSGLNYGGRDQFGKNENEAMLNVDGSYNQSDEGNFQDDNESHDFLDRRAQ